MSILEIFLWVTLPYITLTIFGVGIIYRYRTDQFGWTSKSSEMLEKKYLKWGSTLFHWGILFVLGGHVVGLLIPVEVHRALGVSDHLYHIGAVYGGGLAGLAAFCGAAILSFRRIFVPRVNKTSAVSDFVVILLLTVIIAAGLIGTGLNGFSHSGFEYRETIAPWVRGVLALNADPSLMETVPTSLKVHILLAFTIFALLPFTRLVHIFSVPIKYLWRSYVVYRKRAPKEF